MLAVVQPAGDRVLDGGGRVAAVGRHTLVPDENRLLYLLRLVGHTKANCRVGRDVRQRRDPSCVHHCIRYWSAGLNVTPSGEHMSDGNLNPSPTNATYGLPSYLRL